MNYTNLLFWYQCFNHFTLCPEEVLCLVSSFFELKLTCKSIGMSIAHAVYILHVTTISPFSTGIFLHGSCVPQHILEKMETNLLIFITSLLVNFLE